MPNEIMIFVAGIGCGITLALILAPLFWHHAARATLRHLNSDTTSAENNDAVSENNNITSTENNNAASEKNTDETKAGTKEDLAHESTTSPAQHIQASVIAST